MTRLRDLGISIGRLPTGAVQRHHRRRRSPGRSRHRHRRLTDHGEDRRDHDPAPQQRDLDQLRLLWLAFVQRQRRDDRNPVDRRVRDARLAGRPSPTRIRWAWSATPWFATGSKPGSSIGFHLPVVAETYDGWLSDIDSFPADRVRCPSRDRQCRRRARWPKETSAAGPG